MHTPMLMMNWVDILYKLSVTFCNFLFSKILGIQTLMYVKKYAHQKSFKYLTMLAVPRNLID